MASAAHAFRSSCETSTETFSNPISWDFSTRPWHVAALCKMETCPPVADITVSA